MRASARAILWISISAILTAITLVFLRLVRVDYRDQPLRDLGYLEVLQSMFSDEHFPNSDYEKINKMFTDQ